MKPMLIFTLLGLLLAGCSNNPAKDAVIEDRGVKAAPVTGVDKPDDKAAAETAKAALAQAEAARTTAAKKPADTPETRAVAQPSIETKPIENVKMGTDLNTDQASKGKPVLDPKDPLSPLAQRRILFDYDSSAIRVEFQPMLEVHAEYLRNNKQVKIVLQGSTDERGSPEYNIALGQRRAEAVLQAFSLLGVPENQMEAVSFGEEKPVAEGHDEAAWSQNRRTDIAYPNE